MNKLKIFFQSLKYRRLVFEYRRIDPNFAYTGRFCFIDVSRKVSTDPNDARNNYGFWIGVYFWELRFGFEYI